MYSLRSNAISIVIHDDTRKGDMGVGGGVSSHSTPTNRLLGLVALIL